MRIVINILAVIGLINVIAFFIFVGSVIANLLKIKKSLKENTIQDNSNGVKSGITDEEAINIINGGKTKPCCGHDK